MYELIAQGSFLDADYLAQCEQGIDEGQRARLYIDLRSSISSGTAAQLLNELKQRGVAEATVATGYNSLTVGWRKGTPWLAVIVAAILAIIVLAILVIAWRLYKELGPAAATSFLTGAGLDVGIVIAVLAVLLIKRVRG